MSAAWTTVAACALLAASAAVVAAYAHVRWRRARTLFQASLRLNSTLERRALLRIIMETAEKTLRAEGSSVILLDKEKEELYFEVATGEKGDEVREIRLRMGEGVAGWVADTGRPALIRNAAEDPRWSSKVSERVGMPTRNLICVPVAANGETLGVLQVINKRRGTFSKSDLRLLETVAAPAAVALENMLLYEALKQSMETLRETTAAKERLESELKIARDIQRSFLPGTRTEAGRIALAARLSPAREVGGDLYHFFDVGDGKLLVCLGDVSDKGMPAALFMSGLMIWIRAKAGAGESPAGIVESINREVSDGDSTMFATLFLAVFDTRTGVFRYCDAGHCKPYVLRADGSAEELPTAKGIPVGAFEDAAYGEMERALAPGESLVLYTDGITEAENAQGAWFGTDGLLSALRNCAGLPPEAVADRIIADVEAFAEGKAPSDDIAVMVVRYDAESIAK